MGAGARTSAARDRWNRRDPQAGVLTRSRDRPRRARLSHMPSTLAPTALPSHARVTRHAVGGGCGCTRTDRHAPVVCRCGGCEEGAALHHTTGQGPRPVSCTSTRGQSSELAGLRGGDCHGPDRRASLGSRIESATSRGVGHHGAGCAATRGGGQRFQTGVHYPRARLGCQLPVRPTPPLADAGRMPLAHERARGGEDWICGRSTCFRQLTPFYTQAPAVCGQGRKRD
jgi:hypothetical protein